MKISDCFDRNEQDYKIEIRQKILAFRDIVYADARASNSNAAKKMASSMIFALFGCLYKYKACCVLEFVENAYYGIEKPISQDPVDGRVLCAKCEKDLADMIDE